MRGARDEALYVADEDNAALHVVPLPIGSADPFTIVLPGRPAQVLALHDRVLVTLRDPGTLLTLSGDDLAIAQAVPLADDAWGIAVTPDERTALVTSAWTHTLSGVDLATGRLRFALDVAREPRGMVVMQDHAYVTHLVGTDITRVHDIDGDAPSVTRVGLPAGRFSAPVDGYGDFALSASLAYAPLLSADGERLLVPRHALGGLGWRPWFGRPVVDVLLTADDTPLAPMRRPDRVASLHDRDFATIEDEGESLSLPMFWTVQPRAAVLRPSTETLLVASEGQGWLTELDARALDPSLHPTYRYELIHDGDDADRCGAPSGVALSADEHTAYVWCRTSAEIATVQLKAADFDAGPDGESTAIAFQPVGDDPLSGSAAIGRRLFYDARNDTAHNAGVSGGLGCAGCHPDGRDDGHVWLEDERGALQGSPVRQRFSRTEWLLPPRVGKPRQTPSLAGRVDPAGPYGWRGESASLEERILTGFAIHRWSGDESRARMPSYRDAHEPQAEALAAFLREGLVPPPARARALTALEQRGRELFTSTTTDCTRCHSHEGGYSDRAVHELPLSASHIASTRGDTTQFRTPSLLHVGGTAPYFHDGRYTSLDELVDAIGDSMGSTSALDEDDRAALVAYLATIGAVSATSVQASIAPLIQPLPFPERTSATSYTAPSAEPWPSQVTPEPTRREWDEAEKLALLRLPDSCNAWRVREWLRIQCLPKLEPVFRVALIAGSREGVSTLVEHRTGYQMEGVVIFPVRRGDRRQLAIDREVTTERICSRYRQWMQVGTFNISESWLPDEPAPHIVVSRYGRHPSTGALVVNDHCGW